MVARVERGLQRLREEHDGQTVLLVSHGFVVRCLRYLIDGLNADYAATDEKRDLAAEAA